MPAILLTVVLTLAAAGCTKGAHGLATVRGHQIVVIMPDAEDVTRDYPHMHDDTPVIVVDGQGHRIASGKLVFDPTATGYAYDKFDTDENGGNFISVFDFTVTVPFGLRRYGIAVGIGHGVAWFDLQQMMSGPALTLGSLNFDKGRSVTCRATGSEHVSAACTNVVGGYQYLPGG